MGSDSGNGDDDTPLPLDDLFAILSHKRRRYTLQCLHETGPRLSLPDLADEVSVRTYDCPLPDIPEEDVLAVYTSLYHHHIPQLADAGVVAYEQERDLVRLVTTVEPLLRAIPDDRPDSEPGA